MESRHACRVYVNISAALWHSSCKKKEKKQEVPAKDWFILTDAQGVITQETGIYTNIGVANQILGKPNGCRTAATLPRIVLWEVLAELWTKYRIVISDSGACLLLA